jgi:DNA-binding transcriptional ArsR family regulator
VEPVSDALTALADPTRRRIVDRLAHGAATVSELVAGFDLTQPTISSHLKVLERAGLISRSRVAQTRPCKLEPKGFGALEAWLGQLRSIHEANYSRLDRVLEDLKNADGGTQAR